MKIRDGIKFGFGMAIGHLLYKACMIGMQSLDERLERVNAKLERCRQRNI